MNHKSGASGFKVDCFTLCDTAFITEPEEPFFPDTLPNTSPLRGHSLLQRPVPKMNYPIAYWSMSGAVYHLSAVEGWVEGWM